MLELDLISAFVEFDDKISFSAVTLQETLTPPFALRTGFCYFFSHRCLFYSSKLFKRHLVSAICSYEILCNKILVSNREQLCVQANPDVGVAI